MIRSMVDWWCDCYEKGRNVDGNDNGALSFYVGFHAGR